MLAFVSIAAPNWPKHKLIAATLPAWLCFFQARRDHQPGNLKLKWLMLLFEHTGSTFSFNVELSDTFSAVFLGKVISKRPIFNSCMWTSVLPALFLKIFYGNILTYMLILDDWSYMYSCLSLQFCFIGLHLCFCISSSMFLSLWNIPHKMGKFSFHFLWLYWLTKFLFTCYINCRKVFFPLFYYDEFWISIWISSILLKSFC